MALKPCPACGQRMSDQLDACPNCGLAAGEEVDEETVLREVARRRREKIYRLRMASYVALTVAMIGVIAYWFTSDGFQAAPGPLELVLMAAGSVAYFVVRVLTFAARRRS